MQSIEKAYSSKDQTQDDWDREREERFAQLATGFRDRVACTGNGGAMVYLQAVPIAEILGYPNSETAVEDLKDIIVEAEMNGAPLGGWCEVSFLDDRIEELGFSPEYVRRLIRETPEGTLAHPYIERLVQWFDDEFLPNMKALLKTR